MQHLNIQEIEQISGGSLPSPLPYPGFPHPVPPFNPFPLPTPIVTAPSI